MKNETSIGLFRRWFKNCTGKNQQLKRYDKLIRKLQGKVRLGRKLTRDEMNER